MHILHQDFEICKNSYNKIKFNSCEFIPFVANAVIWNVICTYENQLTALGGSIGQVVSGNVTGTYENQLTALPGWQYRPSG